MSEEKKKLRRLFNRKCYDAFIIISKAFTTDSRIADRGWFYPEEIGTTKRACNVLYHVGILDAAVPENRKKSPSELVYMPGPKFKPMPDLPFSAMMLLERMRRLLWANNPHARRFPQEHKGHSDWFTVGELNGKRADVTDLELLGLIQSDFVSLITGYKADIIRLTETDEDL